MPKQSSRIFAAEIHVATAVGVFEETSLPAHHRRRKGCVEEDRSSVATGEDRASLSVYPGTVRTRCRILLSRLRQRRVEIAVAMLGMEGHSASSLPVRTTHRAPRGRKLQSQATGALPCRPGTRLVCRHAQSCPRLLQGVMAASCCLRACGLAQGGQEWRKSSTGRRGGLASLPSPSAAILLQV